MKNKTSQWILRPLFLALTTCLPFLTYAEDQVDGEPKKETILHEKPSQVPEKIAVKPETADEAIGKRLLEIFQSTGWFNDPKIEVQKGVVFLYGETKSHQFKDWAGDLARNTQDVTAVVNKIVVLEPSVWDVHMVIQELLAQGRKIVRALPAILLGSLILFISWLLARLVYRLIPHLFRDKMNGSLLREVFARAISCLVFIFGLYFIFEMADLTTMAITILSGTGLIGIIVGIAFRDITENFLASVLLSIQNPFHTGDLIDIISPGSGHSVTGYVERLTLRVTILVLLDGSHLQIPNSTVYKSNIRNHSSNPIRRVDFIVSIGTNCSISKAVEAALKVLIENEAILKNPEPLVLADSLTKDSVELHVYYWIDSRKHNWMKIKSSVIRLIKKAFQTEGIEFPGGAEKEADDASTDVAELEHKEAIQTQSETKTHADSSPEKIKGISSPQSQPREGAKNLLDPKQDLKKDQNN